MAPSRKLAARTQEIADRLHATAIHLLRLVRVQDAASGIGPAQLSALSVLVFGGPASLNALAAAEQVRPPTMSRIVDALEQSGLAHRHANENDRRAIVIESTPKGSALLHAGRKLRVEFLAAYLAKLTSVELEQLDASIAAVQKILRER